MSKGTLQGQVGGAAPSVLFVDKVFLRYRRHQPLRGVEVFNLELLRDLTRMGIPVTVPAVSGWRNLLRRRVAEAGLRVALAPSTGMDFLNGWLSVAGPGGPRFDTLLIGNVGKSLLPMLQWLARRRRFRQAVLIAHREATDRFARWMAGTSGAVLAVNEQIAEPFRRWGHPRVVVDYGVMHADRFRPPMPEERTGAAEGLHFAVMGWLDNPWKGADTAVAAFRGLPDEVRERSRLHLASFQHPPSFAEANIRAYRWMPFEAVPGFLRAMDVLLAPSRDEDVMRETFCQAMVQGMLTGLPVVANRLPILAEKLDRGGGLIVDSVEAMSEAMARLSREEGLRRRLGAEGRRIALERYVWDTTRFVRRYLTRAEPLGSSSPA